MGRPSKGRATTTVAPTIVLVRPQLGENIGMEARAMLNCGLSRLCPVRTRECVSHTAAARTIVLVRRQLGENIGMAARAMLNCGLSSLRLVAPRDGWPNPKAERA